MKQICLGLELIQLACWQQEKKHFERESTDGTDVSG